jgi:putative membrane protein
MMYWDGDWSGWTWFATGLSMLVFWVLFAVAIWLGLRAVSATKSASASAAQPPSAEDTLRQRYAEGRIDDQEFRRRLHVLRGNTVTHT